MTTPTRRPHNVVSIAGAPDEKISAGDLTLDARAVPYGAADFELPLVDAADDIDPRDDIRVVVKASSDGGATVRTFNMGARERTIDRVAKTVRIAAATDEALLTDYATLTLDNTAAGYSGLRQVVDYVLGRVYGNLTPNPYAGQDTAGYVAQPGGTGVASVARITGVTGASGSTAIRCTLTTLGTATFFGVMTDLIAVAPGETYSGRAELRASANKSTMARIEWYTAAGGYISAAPNMTIPTPGAGVWNMFTFAGVAPANAASARIVLRITAGVAANDYLDATGVKLAAGVFAPPNLVPGPDADVSPYFDALNLLTDPRFYGTAGGGYAWVNVTVTTDLVYPGEAHLDAKAAFLYPASGADSYFRFGNEGAFSFGMQAGKTYTLSANGSVRNAGWVDTEVNRARRLVVFAYGPSGTQSFFSQPIPTVAGADTRVSVKFTIPANATGVSLRAYHGGRIGPDGIAWAAFRLSETPVGAVETDYFMGNTPDTSVYLYEWTGAVDGSTSRRTALIDRPPEMLVWPAGVAAWDFLNPLTTQAGLRLFCDELRAWRLIDPVSYTVPGFVRMGAENSTAGEDLISRTDPEVFCTGVVVRYAWRDPATGVTSAAVDAAGTPAKVFVVDLARPYPGPGAAAAILARRNGTGRQQDVTALVDWTANPATTASVVLPDSSEQQGAVVSVSFSLGDDATMSVGTAGLIEIPAGAIDLLDGTIDGLVGTIDALNPI